MADGMELEQTGRVPESLWERIRAQPERSPELIALAAAERFGPRAASWARLAGAGQDPRGLADQALKKHVRQARLEGAALGLGGFTTAAADLVALGWIQSKMVFFIAAAMGYDPEHPMRPAELLALTGFYETPAQAREALDGTGKLLAHAAVERTLTRGRQRTITERLVRYAGERAIRRGAGRVIPFVGSPISAVQNAAATKALGERALAYYSGEGQARP